MLGRLVKLREEGLVELEERCSSKVATQTLLTRSTKMREPNSLVTSIRSVQALLSISSAYFDGQMLFLSGPRWRC